jgi:hypothetical protein
MATETKNGHWGWLDLSPPSRWGGSVGFLASDLVLAREWREALGRILG